MQCEYYELFFMVVKLFKKIPGLYHRRDINILFLTYREVSYKVVTITMCNENCNIDLYLHSTNFEMYFPRKRCLQSNFVILDFRLILNHKIILAWLVPQVVGQLYKLSYYFNVCFSIIINFRKTYSIHMIQWDSKFFQLSKNTVHQYTSITCIYIKKKKYYCFIIVKAMNFRTMKLLKYLFIII